MRSAGICVGASSVQCVILVHSETGTDVQESFRKPHDGSPEGVLQDILLDLRAEGVEYCSVTGRRFRNRLAVETISEPEAVERALKEEYPPENGVPDYIVSLGGEARVVYQINLDGEIESAETGSKCASGTGEFFLQQVRRMGLEPKQAVELSFEGEPVKISGRCSVFCKSDCTHALNKGAPVENVLAGLGSMMADMIGELTGEIKDKRILLIGGGTYNTFLIKVLRERCRKVEAGDLSPFFEAYGAALNAADKRMVFDYQDFKQFNVNHFEQGFHPRLLKAENKVEYHNSEKIVPASGETFVLGLDVGSTTTKAMLLRESDRGIGPSVYLRTKGDPVQASRECYRELKKQLKGTDIRISGLGVTGSGRQIAGLHALTEDIVNEIVAHASAALYFNKDVDTIFEIGGQDAKYTYFTNGTPSDYAMNEACSAGTGSFLEEAAYESLNIDVYEIAERALKAENPPNFTDQCSAFISSDIKNAIQEGIGTDDILAGIVYSICLNYINRVKGNRPVGKNVFMQGGVCYNSAVPLAMANLLGADITVPPDPGLMGAFGVANKVLERIERSSKRESYTLDDLIERSAEKVGEFTCSGGKEKCDRGCRVSRIRIGERVYPFGGMCDKYYNLRLKKEFDTKKLDLVKYRQDLMFNKYGPEEPDGAEGRRKRVGLNKSLITYSLYPLFSEFFSLLGFKTVLSDALSSKGIAMSKSSFCMPVESAHGSFHNLLEKGCDYLFLPQVMQIPVENVPTYSRLCPFVQGEPYYLKTTFREEIEHSGTEVLSPVLKMWGRYSNAENAFVDTAESMGVSRKEAEDAFKKAVIKQEGFERELQEKGQQVLKDIESDPERIGIVLLGRPYNAFAEENNMGISHKIASRGYTVIPFDMVPSGNYSVHKNMFWAMGQKILKTARYIKESRNLFGFYITNFSCGPDSFLTNFYRDILGNRPSLILELDRHTADAGVNTRIEAAIDIINNWYRIKPAPVETEEFSQAEVSFPQVVSSDGRKLDIRSEDVELIIPSMGHEASTAVAAVFRSMGIDARTMMIPDDDILKVGRKNTTCKECLPYILITGTMMDYFERKNSNKVSVVMLATGGGPCRLGQYYRAFEDLIKKKGIKDAGVLTLTDENGYGGLGAGALLRGWEGVLLSDLFEDIKSVVRVAAKDPEKGLETIDSAWNDALLYFEGKSAGSLSRLLKRIVERLSGIRLERELDEIPVVSLIGEIFVRRDEFARRNIVEYIESRGFAVRVAPVSEYMEYGNFVVNSGLGEREFTAMEHLKMRITAAVQKLWEKRIKGRLSKTGLIHPELLEVDRTIKGIEHIMNRNFRGEAILTVGLGMREILQPSCGVISIGPFGCMYSRIAESILKSEMSFEGKKRTGAYLGETEDCFRSEDKLPFLAVETDGKPFPQIVEANLEVFVMRAKRTFDRIKGRSGCRGSSSERTAFSAAER